MDRLSGLCLNRTLLQRQHLLSPTSESVQATVQSLIALQAQDPQAPHFALWSRIDGYSPHDLDASLNSGEVVRMATFRSTVMLMTAIDAAQYYPVATRALNAETRVHAAGLRGANEAAVTRTARRILTTQTLTATDLADKLTARFPESNGRALVGVARCTLPLVQTPPRGLWQQSAPVSYRTFRGWVGSQPATTNSRKRLTELALRYVRAFGPSSVGAVQAWLGVTGLRDVIEAMAAKGALRIYDDDGVTVYDDALADIADPETPAPVRMLAPFDHAVVSNPHKERIVATAHYKEIGGKNAVFPGFVLVDGRVAATWRARADKTRTPRADVAYITTVNRRGRAEVDIQCDRLNALLAQAETNRFDTDLIQGTSRSDIVENNEPHCRSD